MERREFLQTLLGAAILPLALPVQALAEKIPQSSALRTYLVLGGAETKPKLKIHYESEDVAGFLSIWDPSTQRLRHHPLPIFVHVFGQHPIQRELALGVAKWTPSAVVVDLRTGQLLNLLKAPDGYRFFGHSLFSRDGKTAYLSANSKGLDRGGICVYDTKTWDLKEILESGSRVPHELLFTPEGTILVSGVPLQPRNLPERMQSQSVVLSEICPVRKLVLRTYAVPSTGHMHFLDAKHVALGNGSPLSKPTLAVLDLETGKIKQARDSKDFPREDRNCEALSLLALNEHELVVTMPEAKEVWLWNTRTNRIRILPSERPLGLAKIGDTIYVNHGRKLVSYQFRAEAMEVAEQREFVIPIGNGAHLRAMSF